MENMGHAMTVTDKTCQQFIKEITLWSGGWWISTKKRTHATQILVW